MEEYRKPSFLVHLIRVYNIFYLHFLCLQSATSTQALIRRAYDLSVISERQYRYLCFQIGKQGMRMEEPGEIPVEKPRALRQMAEKLYGNPVDYIVMANDLKLPAMLVKQIIEAHAEKEPLKKKEVSVEDQTNKKGRKIVPFPSNPANSI